MATTEEMAKQFADESVNSVKQADEDAQLAGSAFAFGLGDEYIDAKRRSLLGQLEARYGIAQSTEATGGGSGESSGTGAG